MKQRILLVEDALDVRALVESALDSSALEVVCAATAKEALSLVRKHGFDLILLDIHLPDRDGLEFFLELRSASKEKEAPVIFLTGKTDVSHKVTAFSLGAEDYIVKPFNIVEFKARVEARLKKARHKKEQAEHLEAGGFRFDVPAQRVFNAEGRELGLTPLEFKIFYFLARHPERIYSREDILNAVWGSAVHVFDRTVDAHVCTLRRKLEGWAKCIESVPGEGYRFTAAG